MIDESTVIASVSEALMVAPGDLSLEAELESIPTYDSVSRLSLMVALSDLIGHDVEPSVLRGLKTLRDVLNFVNKGSR